MTAVSEVHQIEADWVLNDFCNYDCEYCFFHAKKEHEMVGLISPQEYLDFFNRTGRVWLFHFTGGEPLFYPDFAKLCQVLSSSHYVALNSNLASNEILRFAELVDPKRVHYIHCSVHPSQRKQRGGYRELRTRLKILLKQGYPVFASCVMTPSIFEEFEEIQAMLSALDLPLVPKSLRGTYRGEPYPESYSDGQREQLQAFAALAEEAARVSEWNPFRNQPTINPLLDRYFLDGFPDFTGIPCSAGVDFVRIKPDGKVYRCGLNSRIGNLFERRLGLGEAPRPCDDTCCPYICLRYTGLSIDRAQDLPKRVRL